MVNNFNFYIFLKEKGLIKIIIFFICYRDVYFYPSQIAGFVFKKTKLVLNLKIMDNCEYKKDSNEPCKDCLRVMTALYRFGLLQEIQNELEEEVRDDE